jgi:hypothetical protein
MSSESAILSQTNRRTRGLCITCGQPQSRDSRHYCDHHLGIYRERSRAKYRAAHGIPLDAPIHPQATTTAKRQQLLQLEAAFRRVLSTTA